MILSSSFNEHPAGLSPDGQWVVYGSDESGRSEIYVQRAAGDGGKQQVSTDGGTEPLWSPAGGEIFYREQDKMMAVPASFNAGRVQLGASSLLFEGDFDKGAFGFVNYDVTQDGARFLMAQPAGGQGVTQELVVVQNWLSELERLVPVK